MEKQIIQKVIDLQLWHNIGLEKKVNELEKECGGHFEYQHCKNVIGWF